VSSGGDGNYSYLLAFDSFYQYYTGMFLFATALLIDWALWLLEEALVDSSYSVVRDGH